MKCNFIFALLIKNIYSYLLNNSYHKILFPGTHNSYSNLYNPSLPPAYPYKNEILNQQWSITDQLNQGIRVLDIELNSIFSPKKCPKKDNCTFLVCHGTAKEAIEFHLGYSYLEDILLEIKKWMENQPSEYFEPITIILNKQDSNIKTREILKIFNKTSMNKYVYLYDTEITKNFTKWPFISQMKKKKKPIMVFGLNLERKFIQYQNWFITNTPNAYNAMHNTPTIFYNKETNQTLYINQGWDGAQSKNFKKENLIIKDIDSCTTQDCLFVLNVLFSPRNLNNFPFIFGGNPNTQPQVNTFDVLYDLTKTANQILSRNNQQVNWILVDFFNTTYNNHNWQSNPNEGLINVAKTINSKYYQSSKSCL